MGQALTNLRRKRSAGALRELARRQDASETPPLSQETLAGALQHVSAYLVSKNRKLTIIAVGGVVNTLLLENRMRTYDVDFFHESLSSKDAALLLRATRHATKQNAALAPGWLNNHTVLFIAGPIRRMLTTEAFNQNEVVFDATGLRLLAAPWQYLFCTKVDRIAQTRNNTLRPYDQTDAVYYLQRDTSHAPLRLQSPLPFYRLGSPVILSSRPHTQSQLSHS